jgi:hypothetical protein
MTYKSPNDATAVFNEIVEFFATQGLTRNDARRFVEMHQSSTSWGYLEGEPRRLIEAYRDATARPR